MDEISAETPIIDSIRAVTARASTELSGGIEKAARLLPGKLKIFNTSVEKGAELLIQGIHESKDTLLPEFIQGATDLALDLVDYLPQLTEDLADGAEILFTGILDGLDKITDKLIDDGILDDMIETVIQFFEDNGEKLWDTGLTIVQKLGEGIEKHTDEIFSAGASIVSKLADDVIESLPTLAEKGDEIIQKLVTALEEEETLEKLTDASLAIVQSLVRFFDEHTDELNEIIDKITEQLNTAENQNKILDLGMSLGSLLVKGIFLSLTPVKSLMELPDNLKRDWNFVTGQNEYGAGTKVEENSGMKGMLQGNNSQTNNRNESTVVNFNIQSPNIRSNDDIEWFVEESGAAYDTWKRGSGGR